MPELPVGTVTFLFTDIEGSSGLWEEHPDTMRLALARHDALLRAAIETSGGAVFKTVGDAFCAAFPTATQAVDAALLGQQHLQTSAPSAHQQHLPLKVRTVLHTGEAELRDRDYFGPPVNRVARLLSICHGGQVLLSEITHGLVRDDLPAGVGLRELGSHRLKDLQRPEQLYQLTHRDLEVDFPPLRSLALLPNNLPQQVTSFIGREKELAEVAALLGRTRLLTLTGPGGTGKSRLSLHVAADVLEQYRDGVWLVELAPIADPALVLQAVASTLRVREEGSRRLEQSLIEWLRRKQLLLLLDNCEHVLTACSQFAGQVLASCPEVGLLTSSREALNIAGEVVYRVPSLPVPDVRHAPQPVEQLRQYEAVRLFRDRAAAALPSFAITNENAPAVAEICYRLDGIPLAIELAAARVKALSVERLLERLEDRFRILTGGSRTALPRQQTLRALIDWSYDLLSDRERALLRRLSVFTGGWTLEAAESVCGSGETPIQPHTDTFIQKDEVLDLLTSLVDKSLAVYQESPGAVGAPERYRLLETVLEYGREKLRETPEAGETERRHAEYCLSLAEEAKPELSAACQADHLARLEEEHENLRAALTRALPLDPSLALRLAAALWRFWEVRGYFSEGRAWLEQVLVSSPPDQHPWLRAETLTGAGTMAWLQGDYDQASLFHESALQLFQALGDKNGMAFALNNLGVQAYCREEFEGAASLLERSLTLSRETGDIRMTAYSLGNLGEVARARSDYDAAEQWYQESAVVARQVGDRHNEAHWLYNLGEIAAYQGRNEDAAAHHRHSLRTYQEIRDRRGIAMCVVGISGGFAAQGRPELAAQLLGAAEALRQEIGLATEPAGRASYERYLGAIQAALDPATIASAWAAGTAMSLEEMLALIARESGGGPPAGSADVG